MTKTIYSVLSIQKTLSVQQHISSVERQWHRTRDFHFKVMILDTSWVIKDDFWKNKIGACLHRKLWSHSGRRLIKKWKNSGFRIRVSGLGPSTQIGGLDFLPFKMIAIATVIIAVFISLRYWKGQNWEPYKNALNRKALCRFKGTAANFSEACKEKDNYDDQFGWETRLVNLKERLLYPKAPTSCWLELSTAQLGAVEALRQDGVSEPCSPSVNTSSSDSWAIADADNIGNEGNSHLHGAY